VRTLGKLSALTKDENDPIMRLNPTLYNVVKEAKADPNNFTDPFHQIMRQQHQWIDNTKDKYIKDVLYRSDLDHPMSQHNQTSKLEQRMKVSFPQTKNQPLQPGQKPPQFQMNGYYDQEAVSLNNAFKPPKNDFLQPIDNRLYNPSENFNQGNQNKMYQANTELLAEIERTQKMRQFERSQRDLGRMQEVVQ